MGLKGGENGAKFQLTTKHWSDDVFRMYADLSAIPMTIHGATREQTSAAIDGNVVMMRTPQCVDSLRGYVACFVSQIMQVVEASGLNIIVFDEPENLTEAKKAEQQRRDLNSMKTSVQSSDDFDGLAPMDDAYTLETLMQVTNVQRVVARRAARARFFDEVVRQAYPEILARIQTAGYKNTTVIVDGLDRRGANRPIDEKRRPEVYGVENCPVLRSMLRKFPIGEGDMKLAWVEQKVRDLAAFGTVDIKVHMTITIDTDSFAIELIDEARRRCNPTQESNVYGVLCIPERSRHLLAKIEHPDDDEDGRWEPKGFLVCNYGGLLDDLSHHMWNQALVYGHPPPTAKQQRLAVTLLVAGWILSGCDFCGLTGMNAKLVLDTIPSVLYAGDDAFLAPLQNAWKGSRGRLHDMIPTIRDLVRVCGDGLAEKKGNKRKAEKMKDDMNLQTLKRCVWTLAYWHGNEVRGNMTEFGFGALMDTAEERNVRTKLEQEELREKEEAARVAELAIPEDREMDIGQFAFDRIGRVC